MSYPVRKVKPLAALDGQTNGQLDPAIMDVIVDAAGRPNGRLLLTTARAWRAMVAAAAADHITLEPTSMADSYRRYEIQEAIFRQRYTTERPAHYLGTKSWQGQTWYQLPGTAMAAVPGTSNHGWANAVDVANASSDRLVWMLAHAADFGWSWETQSESWHIRYVEGDDVPPAVLAYEATLVHSADDVVLIIDQEDDMAGFRRRKAAPGEEQDQRVYLANGMVKERMLAMTPTEGVDMAKVVSVRATDLGLSPEQSIVVDIDPGVLNRMITIGDDPTG